MPPRAYSLLVDDAVAMLVYLLWAAEAWKRWPTTIMAIHVMLLAKPQGGLRPIALLPSIYRVYTKIRIVHVRRWAANHTRPYFALGSGRSTIDVGARAMVYAEAADARDQDAIITALIDISKCFDRLKWIKIIEAAKHFGFPPSVLRSVLAMYAAPRRIRWGTTFSYA
eukprot:2151607-Pyramimonas_sp.AAC.1